MAKLIKPAVIKNGAGSLPTTPQNKITCYQKEFSMASLQPAAGDYVQLTPPIRVPGNKWRITELHVGYDGAVQQGTDTTISIRKAEDNTEIMQIASSAASDGTTAQEFNNLQEQKATGSTPGNKLLWRTLPAFYIALKYTTAKAAAIGSGKKLRIALNYTSM